MSKRASVLPILTAILLSAPGCGDDDGGSEAIRRGVGAECNDNLPCQEEGQTCFLEFTGGYCGVRDCATDAECPQGSACVTDPDFGGVNYCFLVCLDKPECNVNRSLENESNCTSSIDFVDPDATGDLKVCRPPHGGSV
jgi:hypothetical protein